VVGYDSPMSNLVNDRSCAACPHVRLTRAAPAAGR
jgi:hypothetical protein